MRENDIVAFPQSVVIENLGRPSTLANYRNGFEGMTLRDYFAISSLNALIQKEINTNPSYLAPLSYNYADAMLKERLKNG